MSTLYVDRKDAEVELEGDTVVVRVDGDRQGTTPVALLERVVVAGARNRIGTRLVSKLAELGIGLTVLGTRASAVVGCGWLRGTASTPWKNSGS